MSGTRGPYAKTPAIRRTIATAAAAAFTQMGYRSTSLREIARRANVSVPGLLHHFPTKDALLLEVISEADRMQREHLSLMLAAGPQRLVDACVWLADSSPASSLPRALTPEIAHLSQNAQAALTAHLAAACDSLTRAITAAHPTIDPRNARESAIALCAFIRGVATTPSAEEVLSEPALRAAIVALIESAAVRRNS